jgi:hypothetical protein
LRHLKTAEILISGGFCFLFVVGFSYPKSRLPAGRQASCILHPASCLPRLQTGIQHHESCIQNLE